jgi:hypothetical protein
VIVSMDYIKSDRRREEFKQAWPEFVIMDEAHTCAFGTERGRRQQSFELVRGLAQNPDRHIVLVNESENNLKNEFK